MTINTNITANLICNWNILVKEGHKAFIQVIILLILIILFGFYACIFITIRKVRQSIAINHGNPNETIRSNTVTTKGKPVGILVVIFMLCLLQLCWVPYILLLNISDELGSTVARVATFMALSYQVLNPLLFAAGTKEIRRKILFRR